MEKQDIIARLRENEAALKPRLRPRVIADAIHAF